MCKFIFKNNILLLALMLFIALIGFSQTQYKSNVASGNWSATGSWLQSTNGGTTWVAASASPSSTAGAIRIQSGHSITITTSVSLDEVTIDNGGTVTVNAGQTLTINNGTAAIDFTVNGTLINSNIVTTTGVLSFGSTGVYNHNRNGGTVPTATWSTYSICNINGITSTLCSGITQTFHHLNWNNTGQSVDLSLEGTTPAINGVFKILSTGSNTLYLANSSTTRSWTTIDSMDVAGGTFCMVGSGISSSSSYTMSVNTMKVTSGNFSIGKGYGSSVNFNVASNCEFSGGTSIICNTSASTGYTGIISSFLSINLNIEGNLKINGGSLDLCNSTIATNAGQLYLKGDFLITSGTLSCSQVLNGNYYIFVIPFACISNSGIYFNGSSQTVTYSGGTLSTSSGSAGTRFYYKTSSGPSSLNEIYNGTNMLGTVSGLTIPNNIPSGYAAWPTTGSLIQNVTINNSGGVNLSTSKQINGVLTFTSGKLAIGSNTLALAGTVSGMSANNSFTGSASSVLSITGTGTLGTLYFNQTSPETTNLLSTLTMNRTSTGLFTLGNNVSVTSTLTLTNGLIYTGSNTLSVGTAAANGSISGGSSNSYVVAYDNNGTIGSLKHFVKLVGTFSFPIGDPSSYSPISVTLASATLTSASITAYTKAEKIPGLSLSITNYLNRYWELTPSGIDGPLYSVTYTYNQSDIVGSEANLIPIKKSGGIWNRPSGTSFLNGILMGVGSNNATTNVLLWNTLTSFSSYSAVGNQSIVLPTELISFKAIAQKSAVKLDWQTASEIDHDYFTVERSFDGIHFSPFTRVEGAGNSNLTINYSVNDYDYVNGINYYRLIQTDYNGEETISRIESVDMSIKQNYFIKTVNSLGQEVNHSYTGIVFDIYNDGTSVKRIQ